MGRGQGFVTWDENWSGAILAKLAANAGINSAAPTGRTALNQFINNLNAATLTTAQLQRIAVAAFSGVRFQGEGEAELAAIIAALNI